MTVERVYPEQTVTANATPDEDAVVEIDDEITPSEAVYYYFRGDHTVDLEVVSEDDETTGLPVDAGYRGYLGPFRADSSKRPRFLRTGTGTETVTVQVIRAESLDTEAGAAGEGGAVGTTDQSEDSDSTTSQPTTASFANAAALYRDDGDCWTEVRPLTENLDGSSNAEQDVKAILHDPAALSDQVIADAEAAL